MCDVPSTAGFVDYHHHHHHHRHHHHHHHHRWGMLATVQFRIIFFPVVSVKT
jgi:hypothetical protein